MSSLARRILTAAVLLPLVVALVLWAPAWLFFLGLLPFAFLALWEYLELIGRIGPSPSRAPVFLLGAGLMSLGWLLPEHLLPGLIAAGFVLTVYELFQRPHLSEVLPVCSTAFLGLVYIAVPFALIQQLRGGRDGARLVLLVLALVWIADIGAYAVGKLAGRHKLAPSISPGKTVEGTVGSVLLTAGAGYWLMQEHFPHIAQVHAVVFPLVINALTQIGDLAESALKRGAGVKDSSALLPGHGGVLDRIDSLLFALPAAWYYWGWLS